MKNKKILIYLLTALILVVAFCYFNFYNPKTNVYDISARLFKSEGKIYS